jgi:hypothetical protein
MSLYLCILCILATLAILLMNILDNDRCGWENKSASSYRTDHSKCIVIEILYRWVHPLLTIHMRQYFPLNTHSDTYPHLPLPQTYVATIFYTCSFQVWGNHASLLTLHKLVYIIYISLPIFLYIMQCTSVKNICINYVLSESSKGGLSCHTLTFYSCALTSHRIICETQSHDFLWS